MKTVKLLVLSFLWVVTLLIAIQPYMGSEMASYLNFLTLLILPIAIVNGLILGLLIYKNSFYSYFHGLIALLSFYLLINSSFTISFTHSDKANQSVIRLASCNVENFLLKQQVLCKTASSILDQCPDIVCLQERPHTSLLSCDSIFKTFDFGYTAKNEREDEVLNLAVLSRWPLLNKKEFYFPDSYNKFIQLDIQYPNGKIRLFNVHLQTTGIVMDMDLNVYDRFRKNVWLRNLQADKLSEEIKKSPYPVIVCGDFNDTSLSYAYHKITERLSDCFKIAGKGWGGTFQSIGSLFRIDYILCSSSIKVNDYRLIENQWSDHKIQLGELQFTSF